MISKLEKYAENTREIRGLSSPSLDSVDSPGEYESVLHDNFARIGKLAEENRELLSEMLEPRTKEGYELNEKEISEIINLFFSLVHGDEMDNLDLPLSNRISEILWEKVLEQSDADLSIMIAEMHAMSSYLMMKYSRRTYPFTNASQKYSKEGKKACDYILSFLDFDKWIGIKEKRTRQTILKRASFKYVFYMEEDMDFERNEERLDILRRAISIENQKLYRDTFTQDEWIKYKSRVRESLGTLLESDNIRGFNYAQCCEIKGYMEELMSLWKEYPEICMEGSSYNLDLFYYYRACYYTGEIPGSLYKTKLLEIYRGRSTKKFSRADVILNLLLPVEYVKHMKKRRIMEGESATLEQFYRNAINYVFQCPNLGSIVYILEYLLQLLMHFQEIPGGTTFEEIGLECLAALHPPTYVHSKMVANITRCLCKHMLRLHPEAFSSLVGLEDEEIIKGFRGEILDFAYHSALCHDFGKIAIMDTVFMYGRIISDSEFEQIKAHPQIGERLLAENPSTANYKNIAMGHHIWYDETGGYPFETKSKLKEGIIIDIVTCADCMDAATDTVGRSYSKGISLEEFIEEIKKQAGSRYAPFLPELLEKEEVKRDLLYLLSEVRNVLYRDTFVMLNRLQRLGGYTEIFGGLKES